MVNVGDKAPDFNLLDQDLNRYELGKILKNGPVLLVFYPGDDTPVCTAQLCDYRDHYAQFQQLGVQIYGMNNASLEDHRKFREKHHFPFPLLNDYDGRITKRFGIMSFMGHPKRALFLIGDNGKILYKHVEPIALFRRSSEEVLKDLRNALGVVSTTPPASDHHHSTTSGHSAH